MKNFMALGFANSEEIIVGFFKNTIQKLNPGRVVLGRGANSFGMDELREYEIDVFDFISLFQGDEYQQKMLNALNIEVKEKYRLEEL